MSCGFKIWGALDLLPTRASQLEISAPILLFHPPPWTQHSLLFTNQTQLAGYATEDIEMPTARTVRWRHGAGSRDRVFHSTKHTNHKQIQCTVNDSSHS
jgi:hypothetical protein